jgi:hypothetical protein
MPRLRKFVANCDDGLNVANIRHPQIHQGDVRPMRYSRFCPFSMEQRKQPFRHHDDIGVRSGNTMSFGVFMPHTVALVRLKSTISGT